MREVLQELLRWWETGATAGLATVVRTWQSAPRQPGAAMLVGPDETAVGSVSGGCVEADVYAVAQEAAADGIPVLRRYGVSDADAMAVGLPCGGVLDVFVQPVSRRCFPELAELAAAVGEGRPVALATVLEHPDPGRIGRHLLIRPEPADRSEGAGTLGSRRADAAVTDDGRGLLALGHSEVLTYGPDGERRGTGMQVFVSSFAPRPRMLVFGASDFAAALARLGGFLGYRVTVCDPRSLFATPSRFPGVEEIVLERPERYLTSEAAAGRLDGRTALCVLTHDPKLDVPLLEVALRLPVGYVGAMGSRRSHQTRLDQLRDRGLTDAELDRLASPVGLDLGARTPEETAVSIVAEIIGSRWGGQGRPLRELAGRIHHPSG
ncbi:MAG: XdhC family protein [Friedmanniella sp.]